MTVQDQLPKRVWAIAIMTKPYTDFWLGKKPTRDMVLEALANAIQSGKLDSHFTIELEAEQ